MSNLKNLNKMINEKSIVWKRIDDYVAELMGEGYYYCVSLTSNDEEGNEDSESTEWFIHPNGTFSGSITLIYPNEAPLEITRFGGTFEKSKYNDYVKQMQEFKGEWIEELEYDDALYYDATVFDEEERRMMPRATLDFSHVDPSELPF